MAFREVAMHEVTEVLRLWSSGAPLVRIAQVLALDRKTVRRYIEAAQQLGLRVGGSPTTEQLAGVAAAPQAMPGRPHGESWATCEARRSFVAEQLGKGLKLSKVRRLLARSGVEIPCPTLHRYPVLEESTRSCVEACEAACPVGWSSPEEAQTRPSIARDRSAPMTPAFGRSASSTRSPRCCSAAPGAGGVECLLVLRVKCHGSIDFALRGAAAWQLEDE